MSPGERYSLFHPKWHRRRVSVWWWLEGRSYTSFVLRELTSIFVALFAMLTLLQVRSLAAGPEAYASFLTRLRTPAFVVLNVAGFLAVLFHSITWFNLAPKAVVARFRGKRVPDWVVAGLNYAGWLLLSGTIAAILLRA